MKTVRLVALILLGWGISFSAQAAVTASLNRGIAGPGESVQLTLQRDGRSDVQPDLSPLTRDFKVLGASSGSSIQIINGHVSAKAEMRVDLVAKHAGKLLVPSLQWDGEISPELALTVNDNVASNQPEDSVAGDAQHVYFDLKLDTQHTYVDGAVLLTLRLYTDESLFQASLDLPANSDVKVQQIGTDKQSNESRNGREYQVIERHYALLPQHSGQLKLNGPVLDALVIDASHDDASTEDPFFGSVFAHSPLSGMLNTKRPVHLQGNAISLDVRTRPATVDSKNWLPAQDLTLVEDWRPGNATIHVGDPITRHLRLQAHGTTATQLPDLSTVMALPEGVKAYPDQAKVETQVSGGKLLAVRDQDIALIASQPGHFRLPPVHLTWWDTNQNAARSAELPGRTLDVLPTIGGAGAPTTPTLAPVQTSSVNDVPKNQSPLIRKMSKTDPWQWISLGISVLWLGTMVAWWRRRKLVGRVSRPAPIEPAITGKPATISAAMRMFRKAAKENTPRAARQHLLTWGRATWPDNPPTGLRSLAQRVQEPESMSLLLELDRACYTNAAWQGEPLVRALKPRYNSVKIPKRAEDIADLYV